MIVQWIAVVIAVLLLLACAWIVFPAPIKALLPLSVVTPEVSAWLLLVALATAAILTRRQPRPAALPLALTLASALLAVSPFARMPAVVRTADAGMRAAFGEDYLSAIPPAVRARMRPRVLSPLDLFTGIDPGPSQVTRGIVFSTPQGLPLTLDIYRPPGAGVNRPAIVQIHGGAWQRGNAADDGEAARYFAARGYVVFAISYRLAPRFRWPAPLEDTLAALEWVRTHAGDYGVDAANIALVGRSAGAQVALVAAYAPGFPPIRAVVSYYGPTDLVEGYEDPPQPDPFDVQALLTTYIGGTPDDQLIAYRQASAVTYAIRPLPPTLIIQGSRDHIVAPRFASELHERLRASGNTSVLIEIPWADHAFDAVPSGTSAQLALYYSERFLAYACRSSH